MKQVLIWFTIIIFAMLSLVVVLGSLGLYYQVVIIFWVTLVSAYLSFKISRYILNKIYFPSRVTIVFATLLITPALSFVLFIPTDYVVLRLLRGQPLFPELRGKEKFVCDSSESPYYIVKDQIVIFYSIHNAKDKDRKPEKIGELRNGKFAFTDARNMSFVSHIDICTNSDGKTIPATYGVATPEDLERICLSKADTQSYQYSDCKKKYAN